jgi:hypothetical protein
MKTMTWEEIDKDWGGLQKRHRMEIAQAVARYCVGHKMQEIASRLGYSEKWLQTQLDYAGIGVALGGTKFPLTGSTDNVAKEVPRLIEEFGPTVKAEVVGRGGTAIKVEGKDADAFQPYIDHYVEQGHEPAAAVRLAKAEWAAEEAVNAGVIKEDVNKRNEKVNRILFPDDAKDTFELDLKMHMARVKAAAKFLDQAKMNHLRRKSTCEMVESANEAWVEQVERVLANHSNHR